MAAKSNRKLWLVLFTSLVLDLLAFTAYLPLLPRIMDYYHRQHSGGGDGGDPLYTWLSDVAKHVQTLGPATSGSFQAKVFNVVMGGAVFSIFSLLQLLCMPFMGWLSDRIGRKPVMLLSLAGTAASYVVWASASRFTTFVLFKVVQGALKGNVHVAQSIVTDVTSERDRAKGMAMIGMAYTVAFIIGPMIGGIAIAKDILPSMDLLPNKYSVVALICCAMQIANILLVSAALPETNSKRQKQGLAGMSPPTRLAPRLLLLTSFLWMVIFSGFEYTLPFLCFDRFDYTNIEQGKLFCVLGLTMAVVMGGYMRRVEPKEASTGTIRKWACQTALTGMLVLIPSLLFLGHAPDTTLWVGVVLMGISSAMVDTCITTLLSTFAGPQDKGTMMGWLRGVKSVARAIGPITFSLMYWMAGSELTYTVAALGLFLLPVPLLLLSLAAS